MTERRVQATSESGVLYDSVEKRYGGDPLPDPAYKKTYHEFNAAAFGLAAGGHSGLNFLRGEIPDFEVLADGAMLRSFLEIVRVVEQTDARYAGLLDPIKAALRERVLTDGSFAANIAARFYEIVLPDRPRSRPETRWSPNSSSSSGTKSSTCSRPQFARLKIGIGC